jgi:hypothetical protein
MVHPVTSPGLLDLLNEAGAEFLVLPLHRKDDIRSPRRTVR